MPHITLNTDTNRIDITSELRERDLIKLVPGTRWDTDRSVWTAPLSWGSCVALRGVFGAALTSSESLAKWAWEYYVDHVESTMYYRSVLEIPEMVETEPLLYPFQRAGVLFLEAAKQALIADEMGSGKTIQLVRVIERQQALPALIICPNSMKYTWQKEFDKWTSMTAVVVDGTMAKRRKQIQQVADGEGDVLIINWEALRSHTRLESFASAGTTDKEKESKELNAIEWKAVIADEAHRAKDAKSKQTRALWAVSRNAEYRFAATGTPIANDPSDLWSVMNFVSPEDFPRKTKFVERYCLLSFNPFGGMDVIGVKADMQEEFHKILDPRMIRRLKSIVLPYLPEKVYTKRLVSMPDKQRKAYNQMADHMLAKVDGGLVAAVNPLTQMLRLSQFASAYAEIHEDGDLELRAPSNKIDALMDILDEMGDQQVVVFAESRQLIELAEAKLKAKKISFGLVVGGASVMERSQDIDAFQEGKLRVILATFGAGGEGITLTAARVAVFLQRPWSLVQSKQAEDRIHRPGAEVHDSIEIIDIISKGTIEEYRLTRLAEKEDMLQEVVRDEVLRSLLTYRGD